MRHIQLIIEMHGVIFSAITAISLFVEKQKKGTPGFALAWALVLNMLMLSSDMASVIFDGDMSAAGLILNPLSNYLLYLSEYGLTALLSYYIYLILRQKLAAVGKAWLHLAYTLCGAGALATCANLFTGAFFGFDAQNIYYRGPLFLVAMPLGGMGMLLSVWQILKARKSLNRYETISLTFYFMAPMLGLLLQMFIEGFSFMDIGVIISVAGIFIGYELTWRRQKRRQEAVLLQSRAYLLNSQIQPHFIFNSLNTIQALIAEDPDLAEEAVGRFSKYLRKNLRLEVNESMVSLAEELDYVDNYLYMEKLRFGDKLSVHYELDPLVNFELPFLSIQPLVENAIRHGLRKKIGKGNITIRTRLEPKWYLVEVIDDGVGFDPSEIGTDPADPNSNGVGLQNIEERLRLLCGGFLDITSTPGQGTRAVIHIPQK